MKVFGKIISYIGRGIVIVPQVIVQLLARVFVLLQNCVDFIASASLYGSIVIYLLFIGGGIYNIIWLNDSVIGTIILFVIIASVVVFIYILAAKTLAMILKYISKALGLIKLALNTVNSTLESVFIWFVGMAGKEAYDEYLINKNDKAYRRNAKAAERKRERFIKKAGFSL